MPTTTPSSSSSSLPTKKKPIKCKFCGSDKVIKQGQSQAREPKQKMYCKSCHRFFVTTLNEKE